MIIRSAAATFCESSLKSIELKDKFLELEYSDTISCTCSATFGSPNSSSKDSFTVCLKDLL